MEKMGTPGRNFACNLRVRSAVLDRLSYRSVERWLPGRDSPFDRLRALSKGSASKRHHQPPEPEAGAPQVELQGKDTPARTCTSNLRLRRAACRALTLRERS